MTLSPGEVAPGGKALATVTATIEAGWHLYSMSTPPPPRPTKVGLAESSFVEKVTAYQSAPKRAFDPNFDTETETFEDKAVFLLEVELKGDASEGKAELTGQFRYQACDPQRCLPPVTRTASAPLTIRMGTASAAIVIPAGFSLPSTAAPAAAPSTPTKPADEGLATFALIAFGFGLSAIFTPCVFPMIPIIMSYFLSKPRSAALFHAALFCSGIVVLFSGIGLAVTAALGPFGVVQLGSNVWVNLFIAAIFLFFGLSLLGAYEITIPSSVLTKVQSAEQKGGIVGTLVMGLGFSLTSFACVGPFVGPLLAASAQGGGVRPALGMVAFSSGLATPFFLLALFPGFLQRMPRSGGWLPRVKVVMGFVILAVMLKYVSNIDLVMQWNFLTRERFLAAWVVLFSLAGLYLLGFLRLEGVAKDAPLGLGRLLSGAAFLIFAISLIPGMFGGRLGEIDAYVPLPADSFRGAGGGEARLEWMKNDFRGALERARRENKLVFVNFTGYACTNCHWMKANMFTRPEIAAALREFVLVELYTDGTDAPSVENQKLQDSKFQTIAIPFYAILDPDEKAVATFDRLTKNPQEYLDFLKKGLGAKSAA